MLFKQRLGNHNCTFYLPPKPLSEVVLCFFEHESIMDTGTVSVFAHYRSNIIFDLTDTPTIVNYGDSKNGISLSNTTIAGTAYSWQKRQLPKYAHLFYIIIKPEKMAELLSIPSYELHEQFIDAQLIHKEFHQLHELIRSAKSVDERITIASDWIIQRMSRSTYKQNSIGLWIKQQIDIRITSSASQLAKDSGYSRRHLWLKFREYTGMSIREYSELVRFQSVMHELSAKRPGTLLDLALKYRFYDHKHLLDAVKKFTGTSPSKIAGMYVPEDNDTQQAISIGVLNE